MMHDTHDTHDKLRQGYIRSAADHESAARLHDTMPVDWPQHIHCSMSATDHRLRAEALNKLAKSYSPAGR